MPNFALTLSLKVKSPVLVSAASDLKKLVLSTPSRVAASTLVKFSPDTAGNVEGI